MKLSIMLDEPSRLTRAKGNCICTELTEEHLFLMLAQGFVINNSPACTFSYYTHPAKTSAATVSPIQNGASKERVLPLTAPIHTDMVRNSVITVSAIRAGSI